MKALLLAALTLSFVVDAVAEDLPPESARCREERKTYNTLQQELRGFSQRASQIEELLDGAAPAEVTVDELESLLAGKDGESEATVWPEAIRCESLQQDYKQARETLIWQKSQLVRLRNDYWTALPSPIREAMLHIWESRARLTHNTQALLAREGASSSTELPPALLASSEQLQASRLAFFRLLPDLSEKMPAREARKWLQGWQAAMDLATTQVLPSAVPAGMEDSAGSRLYRQHRRLAQADAVVIAEAFNTVRGWLWSNHHEVFEDNEAITGGKSELLLDESLALVVAFFGVLAEVGTVINNSDAAGTVGQIFLGLEYLTGLLAIAALAIGARAIRKPAGRIQAAFARRYHGSRARAQLIRLTTGIPVLLPWIVGWVGLHLLEHLFHSYHLALLLPILPFARLYIIYGLLSLVGEWYLHRIAGLAGSYLNAQQHEQMVQRARRFARVVILPWFLMDLVNLGLGPSLTLEILEWLTLVAVVIALGLLLKPWRKEYILALQSFLPETCDHWIERLFAGWRFVLLAPLTAPLMLAAVILFFLHKGLVDFDWYRMLMARSFRLRSGQVEEEASAHSDESALADYQRWFEETLEDGETPFINTDVAERLEATLGKWVNETSEENSLLLSGEHGSGKSTVLQKVLASIREKAEGVDLTYLEVPAKCIDPAAIAALLEPALGVSLADGPGELVKSDSERKPAIVVLDNAQNFFLRRVGGLEGWEYLLSLTRARLYNVFWVISINDQSWAYLGNVFGREYQFNKLLQTRRWSQNDVRSLILSRNQLSGYRIHYDSILLSSRGPEAGNIRNAEQLYFSLLWDACRGNPLLALRLWLSSITVAGKVVTVGLPVEVSSAALERLGKEMHFVYAALVLHENMTSEELVSTTALPESRVRAALKTAFDIGFVDRSKNRRYRIIPVWYPVVTRLLARKNLLHE